MGSKLYRRVFVMVLRNSDQTVRIRSLRWTHMHLLTVSSIIRAVLSESSSSSNRTFVSMECKYPEETLRMRRMNLNPCILQMF